MCAIRFKTKMRNKDEFRGAIGIVSEETAIETTFEQVGCKRTCFSCIQTDKQKNTLFVVRLCV